MLRLRFNGEGVSRCIKHALASEKHNATYSDDRDNPGPGLWFVKDDGVYILSNGDPGDVLEDGDTKLFVVYADGFDPKKVDFDDWYHRAREGLGGDDFVDVIDLGKDMHPEMVEALREGIVDLVLDVNQTTFTIRAFKRKGAKV